MNKFTETSEKGFQKYSTEIEISSALPNKLPENFAPSFSRSALSTICYLSLSYKKLSSVVSSFSLHLPSFLIICTNASTAFSSDTLCCTCVWPR